MSLSARLDSCDGTPRPLVEEWAPAPRVIDVFSRLSQLPFCVFFDSALRHPTLGRYSFLAADPFFVFRANGSQPTLWRELAERLQTWRSATAPEAPPFQGGAAGLFSYDLNRTLEKLPSPRFDEFGVPALAVGFYDVVVAFDHTQDRCWLISQGLPETELTVRRRRAAERLDWFRQFFSRSLGDLANKGLQTQSTPVSPSDLATQYPTDVMAGLTSNFSASAYREAEKLLLNPAMTSNFSASAYREAVAEVVNYIVAGDVFQVNLAQRLLYPKTEDPVKLYLRLRRENPAPFAGYFDLGEFQILSASPERFLQVRDGWVESRPIKGTRRRTAQPEADLFAGDELRQSEKDRAENVMIVDLMRNDLSMVCQADSVQVTQLCQLENYQYVQHLVSAVQGRLEEGKTPLDLLRGAFPGGSITGAPKFRAMEIIAELEPTARGAYCGSLGYLGFDAAMDSNILIRTITAGRGWLQLPVGGGIVAQSSPPDEYEETWHKARGLLAALAPPENLSRMR